MRHSYPGALCRIERLRPKPLTLSVYVSLSALSPFSWTAARYSISCFLILLRPKWLTSWKVLLRVTEEGVENDDIDELGQGIEVGHSSCTVYVSGSFQLKRWEGIHNSWRHHFQHSFARFSSPFPNADLPLYGTRLHSLYLFWLSNSLLFNSLFTPLLVLDAVELLKLLQRTDSLRWKAAECWHKKKSFCCFDRDSSTAQGIFFDTSNMEASSRSMSAVRGRWTGVLSTTERWYDKREGGRQKPVQSVTVVSTDTANQEVQALSVSPSMVVVLI